MTMIADTTSMAPSAAPSLLPGESPPTPGVPVHLVDRLFPAVRLARFLFDVYPHARCIAHGDLQRLSDDLDVAALARQEPEDLLRSLDPRVSLIAYESREEGAEKQRTITAREAVDWYRAGSSISIEVAHGLVPGVASMNSRLVAELGLPSERTAALVVSPAGSQVPVHFDGVELLVVQLVGRKCWRLADEGAVEHPDFAFFPSEGGPGPRGGRSPRGRPLAPSTFDSVELVPGSVLFVPRGTWHATRTIEATVNVVFRLVTPMAATLVARAIEAALREDPRWRIPIAGVAGGSALQRLAAQQLRPLLPRLLDDVQNATLGSATWVLDAYRRELR